MTSVRKFRGTIRTEPLVSLNKLSANDMEIAEQLHHEIDVEIIDTADYDPTNGETLPEWALLNEFHETVAIDVLDHFSIEVMPDAEELFPCPKCGWSIGRNEVCEECGHGEVDS